MISQNPKLWPTQIAVPDFILFQRHVRCDQCHSHSHAVSMGRNGFMGSFQGLDAFGKVRPPLSRFRALEKELTRRLWKTSRSGPGLALYVSVSDERPDPVVTFISFSIILTSVLLEFIDYRRIHLEPSLIVDRSRGEKLVIEMDITFPRVPCYRASSRTGNSLSG